MTLCVTVYLPGQPGEKFVFEHGDISIGRAEDNDLVLGERGVSGRHARLLVTGDEVTLIDLESTNGTYVNGQRSFGPTVLQPTDDIALCEYRLLVTLTRQEAAVPRLTAPPPLLAGPAASQRVAIGRDSGYPASPVDRSMPPPPIAHHQTQAPALLEADGGHPAASFIESEDEPQAAAEPGEVNASAYAGDPMSVPSIDLSVPPPIVAPAVAQPSVADERRSVPPVDLRHARSPSIAVEPAAGMAEPPLVEPPPLSTDELRDTDEVPPLLSSDGTAEPASLPPTARPISPAKPVARGSNGSGAGAAASPPRGIDHSVAPPAMTAAADAATPRRQETTSPHVADRPLAAAGAFTVDDSWSSSERPAGGRRDPAPVTRSIPPEWAPSGAGMSAAEFALASGAGARSPFGAGEGVPLDAAVGVDEVYRYARTYPEWLRDRSRLGSILERFAAGRSAEAVLVRLEAELAGQDALALALADPEFTDLWLHDFSELVIRRGGSVDVLTEAFSCPAAVDGALERIAGRRFDAHEPFVDVFTPDGVHVRAVHGSWTQSGTAVWATRMVASQPNLDDLVRAQEMSREIADLLAICVEQGLRVLVCGGPDVSTAPLLHALAAAAPEQVRQVVVCCGQAMPPTSRHGLVLRAPRQEALRGLIDTALQFDPRRLLVHGIEGAEAGAALMALARLPAGGVLSLQAATATDGLRRLANMFRLAEGCTVEVAVAYIAGAVDLVIGLGKIADGRQLVLEVAEASTAGAPKDGGSATPVAVYDGSGGWVATGVTPRFFSDLRRRGVHLP